MKSTYSLALMVTVTLAVARTAHADESFFRANEASIDLFGTVSIGQETINHISGNRVRKSGHKHWVQWLLPEQRAK